MFHTDKKKMAEQSVVDESNNMFTKPDVQNTRSDLRLRVLGDLLWKRKLNALFIALLIFSISHLYDFRASLLLKTSVLQGAEQPSVLA